MMQRDHELTTQLKSLQSVYDVNNPEAFYQQVRQLVNTRQQLDLLSFWEGLEWYNVGLPNPKEVSIQFGTMGQGPLQNWDVLMFTMDHHRAKTVHLASHPHCASSVPGAPIVISSDLLYVGGLERDYDKYKVLMAVLKYRPDTVEEEQYPHLFTFYWD